MTEESASAEAPPVRLTEWTACGGCAAKWGGAPLSALVRDLAARAGSALMVGLAPFDDAAVYRLDEHSALVSTTDFFPPLVDGPADFGAIAAANACSDVFAMGGRVILALNVAAFPERMPVAAIAAILAAAGEVVVEAGGSIAGGHTIRSEEPIFGLAVQGLVHPDRIWTKGGARVGDVLVLSKPLGTGIVLAGGGEDDIARATAGMRTLNRFGGDAAHQKAMFGNLVASLIAAEGIVTTEAKAKALRPVIEKCVTKARKAASHTDDKYYRQHQERLVVSFIRDKDMAYKLFEEIGPRYVDRQGGYTRILKLGPRHGDNAPMARIEFV